MEELAPPDGDADSDVGSCPPPGGRVKKARDFASGKKVTICDDAVALGIGVFAQTLIWDDGTALCKN